MPDLMCGDCLLRTIAPAKYFGAACPLVGRDFNQVFIWVAHIDGAHCSHCAVAFDRAFLDVNFLPVQVANHFVEWCRPQSRTSEPAYLTAHLLLGWSS
jgi:hypothetical protein